MKVRDLKKILEQIPDSYDFKVVVVYPYLGGTSNPEWSTPKVKKQNFSVSTGLKGLTLKLNL